MADRLFLHYRNGMEDEYLTMTLPLGMIVPEINEQTVAEIDETDFGRFLLEYYVFISDISSSVQLVRLYRLKRDVAPSERQPEYRAILTPLADYDLDGHLLPLVRP